MLYNKKISNIKIKFQNKIKKQKILKNKLKINLKNKLNKNLIRKLNH